jgi:uncharacterized glyoxalase superfamily protein PhnB
VAARLTARVPAAQAGLIIHAALTFDDHLLMGSDDPMSTEPATQ